MERGGLQKWIPLNLLSVVFEIDRLRLSSEVRTVLQTKERFLDSNGQKLIYFSNYLGKAYFFVRNETSHSEPPISRIVFSPEEEDSVINWLREAIPPERQPDIQDIEEGDVHRQRLLEEDTPLNQGELTDNIEQPAPSILPDQSPFVQFVVAPLISHSLDTSLDPSLDLDPSLIEEQSVPLQQQPRRSTRARVPTIRQQEATAQAQEQQQLREAGRQNRVDRDARAEAKEIEQLYKQLGTEFRQSIKSEYESAGSEEGDSNINHEGLRHFVVQSDFYKEYASRWSRFLKSVSLLECSVCHELWPAKASSTENEEAIICEPCKHDKKRAGMFSRENRTTPFIFRKQKEFADAFYRGALPNESEDQKIARAQHLAQIIETAVPRSPINPLYDCIEHATIAELSLLARVRLFLYLYMRGGGVNYGTKGTAIAFRGVNPALDALQKLPNTVSPFVLVRVQRSDGTYPDPPPEQKVRRELVIRLLQYLMQFPLVNQNEGVDGAAVNRLPDNGYMSSLVTFNVREANTPPPNSSQLSNRVAEILSEASSQTTELSGFTHEEDLQQQQQEQQPPPVPANDDNESDDDNLRDVDHNDGEVDEEGQIVDEEGKDKEEYENPNQTEYNEKNHDDTRTMLHAEQSEMSFLETINIAREDPEVAILGLLNLDPPEPVAGYHVAVNEQSNFAEVFVHFKRLSNPEQMNHPYFFVYAFPFLFCDMDGVPQFPNANVGLQALHPMRAHKVDGEKQVQHLIKLGYTTPAGQTLFPFQKTIQFLIVSRQIISRVRVSRNCSWRMKNNVELNNLTLADVLRIAKQENGAKELLRLYERCQTNETGSPAYFKQKSRLAQEIHYQLPTLCVFSTRSFADIHHPVLLNVLGMNPSSLISARSEAVRNAPGVGVEVFRLLRDFQDEEFFSIGLGRDFSILRDEFQNRHTIHDHQVSAIPCLHFKDAVDRAIKGHSASDALFRRQSQLTPEEREFATEEGGIDEVNDDTLSFLFNQPSDELIELVKRGREAELLLCAACEIMHCEINPIFPEIGAIGSLEQMAQARKEFINQRNQNMDQLLDAITFALLNDPKGDSSLPFETRIALLLQRSMIHHHVPSYCYNTKERLKKKECRFHYPKDMEPSTRVKYEYKKHSSIPVVEVVSKRNDPLVGTYCEPLLGTWCANCDFRIVFDADKIIHYTLKYTLKKDVGKPLIDDLTANLKNNSLTVTASAGMRAVASRMANRLEKGMYDSPRQFFTDLSNATAGEREVGAPELVSTLLSQPLVRFRDLKFVFVPALFGSELKKDDSAEQGVKLSKNVWEFFATRCALAQDRTQINILGKDLGEMNAAEFFGKYYVNKNQIITEHDFSQGQRVTIWPMYCSVHEPNPESNAYFHWQRWFLLRWAPWQAESPRSYMQSLFGRALDVANTHRVPISSELQQILPTDIRITQEASAEFKLVLRSTFDVLTKFDEKVQKVFETDILRYQRRKQMERDIRNQQQEANGGSNHPHSNLPDSVEEEDEADAFVADGLQAEGGIPLVLECDGTLPENLIATKKSDVLPEVFRRLDAGTLAKISALAKKAVKHGFLIPKANELKNPNPPPMTDEQREAFMVITANIDRGGPVFLHGGPGTGKSTVIHHLRKQRPLATKVFGSTGKAGFLLGGETVHRGLLLYKDTLKDDDIETLKDTLAGIDTIIIDEASMISEKLHAKIESVLREVVPRAANKPWGGYRVLFSGDFGQCPAVNGRPFHTYHLFNDFEVCQLFQTQRTLHARSIEIYSRMRSGTVAVEDANYIRGICAASANPQRAQEYSNDWEIHHIVTTNAEVDDGNSHYITEFARSHDVKILSIPARKHGTSFRFAIGAKMTLLKNIRTDYGMCNGMFGKGFGALFDDYSSDDLNAESQPSCILVRADDTSIDCSFGVHVRNILYEETSMITTNNETDYQILNNEQVDEIVSTLANIVPIGYVDHCEDVDGSGANQKWEASIPLRLARYVTVHKVQGMSMPKLIMTPGSRKMYGTTLTGFTRCTKGFEGMILPTNYDDEHLIDAFLPHDNDDLNLVKVEEKLSRLAAITRYRAEHGTLYTGAIPDDHQPSNNGPVTMHFEARRRAQTDPTGRASSRGGRGGAPSRGVASSSGVASSRGRGQGQRRRGGGAQRGGATRVAQPAASGARQGVSTRRTVGGSV